MKKNYIVPNLTIVKVNVQHHMMAGSEQTPKKPRSGFQLGGGSQGNQNWEKVGDVEEDADLAISAKHFDAWSSWDE